MALAILLLSMFLRFLFLLNKDSEIIVCPLSNLNGIMNYRYAIHHETHQSLILNSSDEMLQPV